MVSLLRDQPDQRAFARLRRLATWLSSTYTVYACLRTPTRLAMSLLHRTTALGVHHLGLTTNAFKKNSNE